jgi:hypothetical protein
MPGATCQRSCSLKAPGFVSSDRGQDYAFRLQRITEPSALRSFLPE